MLRKLLRFPYGIVEASRQWLCAVEHLILDDAGLETITRVDQLLAKQDIGGLIILLVSKVVEDFLLAGLSPDIAEFLKQLANILNWEVQTLLGTLSFLGATL